MSLIEYKLKHLTHVSYSNQYRDINAITSYKAASARDHSLSALKSL